MSEKASSTSLWLKFFRGAGIPSGIDTKYALIFDENRIRMDMLMDLNKEILRDMGIVAMGDIIAILKHARRVHDETKEQAVEPHKPTQSQTSNSPSKVLATSTQGRSSGSSHTTAKPAVVESKKEVMSSTHEVPSATRVKISTTAGSSRVTERVVQSKGQPQAEKIRQEAAPKKMIVLNKRSSSEGILKEEVPVQKKIRVLPEQEGRYTIKMPEGTTPRTKKIIQSRLGPGPTTSTFHSIADKKTVFARLGDSSVSSSTEDARAASQPVSDASESRAYTSQTSKQSVFDRLGGRGKQAEGSDTSTSASSQPKPLLQMKVNVPEHSSSVRSRLDTKTHQEKTLKTIPSRISIPYLTNRAKVRSEIGSAVTSATTSTTTRIISAKSSVPASTIQRNPVRSTSSRESGNDRSGNRDPVVSMRGISDFDDSDYDADQGRRVGSSSRTSSSSLEKRIQDIIRSPAPPPIDGQVLQTIRMPSKTKGKVIVKKLIYKKIPKTSGSADLAHLPEIDDPLANYYDDSDD